jgi:hypothetical protein
MEARKESIDFYDWLSDLKKARGLTNEALGEIIDKSKDA